MYANLRQRLFEDIHSDDKFSISFTTYIWSRDGGESFISWTAHYITSEFHRDERVLQVCLFPGSHTADAISGMILKLLNKWSIDKSRVQAIVRDNTANMVAGIRQCGLLAISCTIHTLQLVVEDSILVQRSVIDMLARCRKIVGHFKHSSFAIFKMNRLIGIQVITCFEQRHAICLYDADYGLPEELSANEWQQAEKIVKLLEPVQHVTKELSVKEASISQVIPFLETLQIELSTPRESDSGIKPLKKRCLNL